MTRPPRIGLSCYPRTVDIATGPTRLHTVSRWYVDRIVAAGGLPLLLPVVEPALAAGLVGAIDGVVLTGGGDVGPDRYEREPQAETKGVDEARDAFELSLVKAALEGRVPLLAICRGAQVLNVALGGTLVQHVPEHLRTTHAVRIDPGSHLAAALGVNDVAVNSLHHQAIGAAAPGVRAVGWAPDGTIEAVQVEGHPEVLAVQWHPELLEDDDVSERLFASFIKLTAASGRR